MASETEAFRVRRMLAEEANICEDIVRSLPEWFGIEASIIQYRRDLEHMECFVAEAEEGIVGLLAINQHNDYTAGMHVMAVKSDFHRHGVGRALVKHVEELLHSRKVEYLEVKILGPSRPAESYARTRAFYTALGFRPLEENNLWGEDSPCLIMVKHLACKGPVRQ
ncbi:MAG: GNAT family N-acetyltransferase [Chloroflexi bacterium]|nr:GNAT family N-acetyltransferase [Chloroflexota bacterium]